MLKLLKKLWLSPIGLGLFAGLLFLIVYYLGLFLPLKVYLQI